MSRSPIGASVAIRADIAAISATRSSGVRPVQVTTE